MNICIRAQIEYEKILPDNCELSLLCTRSRMSLQYLLDSHNHDHLKQRLIDHISLSDKMLNYVIQNPTMMLNFQPTFEWSIDNKIIQTPCWRVENILPRILLTRIITQDYQEQLQNGSYKESSKQLSQLISYHEQIKHELQLWRWKNDVLQHDELQTDWHESRVLYLEGLKHLCTLCVGLDRNVGTNTLFVLTQKALKSFACSVATWRTSEAGQLLPVVECLRHYFSADLLWSQAKYGGSIYRLKTWCSVSNLDFGAFHILQTTIENVPFLLNERIKLNNSVYYEPVESTEPLLTPIDLITASA